MKRKPRTLGQIDQWADSRERFLGIDRARLSLAQRRKLRADTIAQEKAREVVAASPEGQKRQALEEQRIEVLAEIEEVRAGNSANKHRRLAALEEELKRLEPLETPAERRTRLAMRARSVRADGDRAFLKTVAGEEGISVARLKQLISQKRHKRAG